MWRDTAGYFGRNVRRFIGNETSGRLDHEGNSLDSRRHIDGHGLDFSRADATSFLLPQPAATIDKYHPCGLHISAPFTNPISLYSVHYLSLLRHCDVSMPHPTCGREKRTYLVPLFWPRRWRRMIIRRGRTEISAPAFCRFTIALNRFDKRSYHLLVHERDFMTFQCREQHQTLKAGIFSEISSDHFRQASRTPLCHPAFPSGRTVR